MAEYIALLRGINVGGHKKLLMKDLRMLVESLGFTGVRTYIHSGNLVFSAEEGLDHSGLISEKILEKYGWEVPVLVISPAEVKEILDACPFPTPQKEKSYFMLLYQPPLTTDIETTLNFVSAGEKFYITSKCVYFYSELPAGKSRLSNNFFERKLKVIATTRNFNTLIKLLEMSN